MAFIGWVFFASAVIIALADRVSSELDLEAFSALQTKRGQVIRERFQSANFEAENVDCTGSLASSYGCKPTPAPTPTPTPTPLPCIAAVDCSGHGSTSDLDKTNGCDCSCYGGFSGGNCAVPPPCAAATDCSGHGSSTDVDATDGCDCECTDGYSGDSCALPPPCDALRDCNGHGTTKDMDSTDGCTCECTDSFTGKNCDVPPPCTPALDCGGHGTTEDKDKTDGCVCDCFDNYTGKDCSEPPPCDADIKAKYSVNGHSYEGRVLQSGALIWTDRSYTVTVPPELDGAIFFVQPHKTIHSGSWHLSGVPVGSRVFVSSEHTRRNGGFSFDSTWSHLTDSTTWLFKNQPQTLRVYEKTAITPEMSLPISGTWVGFVAYFPLCQSEALADKVEYSVNGHSYKDRVLQSGALIWTDRSYTVTVPPELDGAIFFVQPHKTINSGSWHLSGVPVGSRVFVAYELHHSRRNGGFSFDSTWSHLTDSTTWRDGPFRIYQQVATTPDMSLPISSTWVGFVAYFPPGQVEVLK